ncbi:Asp-tRNA(Asn)/Glu-tRNA(Gln) amidotransferase subunit GatA [Periweissella beninensis]|uniref:Asp-tRNA(Asn)/Glu-tRNA(Gln) amidotransferase subunit GatA n=1 Tax=Periweissella beninensis TaxID=504936 RepID=UPI0021A3B579|nr:Asp-tRNA(Asn)/Glu-tRNA(Gln) amidotransferase subunit GatA [Periweissella beninensis]MCT4395644.1 Asp-tRNA(Asn)/Glu-tRNA(Gln) amidotransferase subunit GatA [Periweissella beninensis]
MNYFETDLTQLHDQLVNKEISSVELTQATLANIKKTETNVNAFITVNDDAALAQAKAVDDKGIDATNLFSGIPIAIKDNILTKDILTTAGSKMLSNFKPVFDATVTEKLYGQDAIMIGKTNMDEFAMGSTTETSYFNATKNAWDYTKVPGGSSGGSASAVASGEVLAALGTDTGGSIRQPAAFNGIVGLKPTYGRVSRWGLIAFGSSLDQIGQFTRTVRDNAAVLNIIAGHDQGDQTSSQRPVPDYTANLTGDIKGMKIALPKEYLGAGISQEVKETILAAAKQFEAMGATVEEVSLPHSKYGVAAYYIIASSEASSNLQRFDGIRYGYRAQDVKNLNDLYVKSRTEGFGDEVKRRIMLGTFSLSAGSYDAFFKKAAQVRTLIIQDFQRVFEKYDLIMGPTTPTVAFDLGTKVKDPAQMYMNDVLTIPVNFAGLPGMSINAGFSEGMPVGMHLIAKHFDEETLYKVAYAFEQVTQLFKQTPQVGGQK